jgi:hypothetical protein
MLTQEKTVLSEDGKTYSLQVKKMWFQMQVSVAYSSFLPYCDDKILLVLLLKTIQLMESQ